MSAFVQGGPGYHPWSKVSPWVHGVTFNPICQPWPLVSHLIRAINLGPWSHFGSRVSPLGPEWSKVSLLVKGVTPRSMVSPLIQIVTLDPWYYLSSKLSTLDMGVIFVQGVTPVSMVPPLVQSGPGCHSWSIFFTPGFMVSLLIQVANFVLWCHSWSKVSPLVHCGLHLMTAVTCSS